MNIYLFADVYLHMYSDVYSMSSTIYDIRYNIVTYFMTYIVSHYVFSHVVYDHIYVKERSFYHTSLQ
jgi:hypothetical protein